MRLQTLALLLAFLIAATSRSWTEAVPVNFDDSHIEIVSVISNWASDPDYVNNRQGPIYFHDCLTLTNEGSIDVTHVQVMFAPVDLSGNIKRPPMPHDSSSRIRPGAKLDVCRDHAYANGVRGWWLVGWVNVVTFADSTVWHAPDDAQLRDAIVSAIPQSGNM